MWGKNSRYCQRFVILFFRTNSIFETLRLNDFKLELGCWLCRNSLLGMLRQVLFKPDSAFFPDEDIASENFYYILKNMTSEIRKFLT